MLKIASAAIVGIPCFVVAICMAPVVALLSIPTLAILLFRTEDDGVNATQPDQVIITGGSSGIGFSIAKECVSRGVPKITLIARNLEKLQKAQAELQAMPSNCNKSTTTQIEVVSVSVSDFDALQKAASDLKIPPSDRVVLWNCAGTSYPAEFQKVPLPKFEQQVMTNQLGTMYLVRAFLPYLNKGCIVLTSSAAGQLGVYGYTTYAPTKYAIRGFAETLHAELIRSHPQLSIQLAYPVDTDTPGYQEELKTTPEITKKLSETGGVACADQ
jgi:3-dehydrosphinganine reductase